MFWLLCSLPEVVSSAFSISAILVGTVLILIFLTTNEVEYPLHTLTNHLEILFCERCSDILPIFIIEFLLLAYRNSLYILFFNVYLFEKE